MMQNSSNIKRRDFIICPHGTYQGQDWDLHYCSIAHFFVVFWWKKISHGSLKSCIVLKPLYIPKQHYLHWCGSLFSGHMQNDPDKRFQWNPAKNSQTGDHKFFQFLLNKFETFVVMIIQFLIFNFTI